MRLLTLLAVALSCAAAPAAGAAVPKPACDLVVDKMYDATGFVAGQRVPEAGSNQGLDVTAVNLAATKTVLTVEFTFASFSSTNALSPFGRQVDATLKVAKGPDLPVKVVVGPTGTLRANDGAQGYAADWEQKKLRVYVPVAALSPKPVWRKSSITVQRVATYRWVGTPDAVTGQVYGDAADTTETPGRPFLFGATSCLRAGGPA